MAKSKSTAMPYIRLMSLVHSMHGESLAEHIESEVLLAFIGGKNAENEPVRISEILNLKEFGSHPTIRKKLQQLIGQKLVATRGGDDLREKHLYVTAAGLGHLEKRSAQIQSLLNA